MSDQDSGYKIIIDKIENDVIWLSFEADGKKCYRVPLAQVFRDFLEPEFKTDEKNNDKFGTEQSFKKLEILKSLEKELFRA